MKNFKRYLNEKTNSVTGIEKVLGPTATSLRDKLEIKRQKEHLTNQAKEYHDQAKREGGGGAAQAKGDSFENAKKAIHSEEVMAAAPTNSVAGVAGSGDSRLPSAQREPGVSKKRTPVLKGLFTRKPPQV